MKTLRETPVGQSVRVAGLRPGLAPSEQRRLGELGFCDGARVRYLFRAPLGGPYVYEVSGSVFSLEARLAAHIEVAPLDVVPHPATSHASGANVLA
jgi:Fe2+ transport system protein FeoA